MEDSVRVFIESTGNDGSVEYVEEADFSLQYEILAATIGITTKTFGPTIWQEVRNPKGLPKNLSDEVKRIRAIWGSDGYSSSWLSLEEVVTLQRRVKEVTGEESQELGNALAIMRYIEELNPLRTSRLVYWFETED